MIGKYRIRLTSPYRGSGSTLTLLTVCMLAGCGQSANSPAPASAPIATRPDVIVTLDGKHHECVVALYSEAQGSSISCNDVVAFVKDELRVAKGSIYDIRTIPDVDAAEMAKVEASLKDAGYRSMQSHAAAVTN
jgi:hypothetical protein